MASTKVLVNTSWATPRTWVANEYATSTLLNAQLRDLLNGLKNPASFRCVIDEAADYTTTLTSFVDVDATNLSATIVTGGGVVQVKFTGTVKSNSAGQYVMLNLLVDGSPFLPDDGIHSIYLPSNGMNAGFCVDVPDLAAGSHTFTLQWKTNTGTASMPAGAGTTNQDHHPTFSGIELG